MTTAQVNESARLIKALLLDAIGTKDPADVLDMVAEVERQVRAVQTSKTHVRFELKVGKYRLALMGGSIHAWPEAQWDVFPAEAGNWPEELDAVPVPDDCLSTAEMFARIMKVARL